MENLKQKIERLQSEKKTQHRPDLLNDQQYADWLESLVIETKAIKKPAVKKAKK